MNPKLRQLREKAMNLPLSPGVYIMKNKSGEIIYIGKAKALKNRVSQYFGSDRNHQEKVRRMVSNVDDFDYILTSSEFEALVLECSLIKQHQPKYNILLKDDKGYSYIRISNEDWCKISHVMQKNDDGATYIGPYTSSWFVKNAVDEARKIFKLPSCNKCFPRDFRKSRPCLNYYIKQCCAPCRGNISLSDYRERVDSAIDFLKMVMLALFPNLKSVWKLLLKILNLNLRQSLGIELLLSSVWQINRMLWLQGLLNRI